MNKPSILLAVLPSLLLACGGATPTDSTAPTPRDTAPRDTTPTPTSDCSTPPDAQGASAGASGEAFIVTGEAIAAGTARQFSFATDIIVSQSEGGSRYVKIHGVDDCGLWLAETYVGSEIGGDADVRKTTITRVAREATAASYMVETLGAKLEVMGDNGLFTVTLLTPIETYEGE